MSQHRLLYIDHLRVFLTILVVTFHLAITYGFEAGWYFYDSTDDVLTQAVLTYFIIVNQAFFMSLFFGISGFFTPASYDRKGPLVFLKDRFLRLGIPLLLYVIIVDPILRYVYDERTTVSFSNYIYEEISQNPLGLITKSAPGPMWFVEALLIFSLCYVIVRTVIKPSKLTLPTHFPKDRSILLFVIVLSLLNYLIRIWSPVGNQVIFLQIAHFAPYIGYFIVGIFAFRAGWLHRLSVLQVKKWSRISLICILLFPAIMYLGGAFDGKLLHYMGGWHWQSFVYSFWEPFVCIGVSLRLLWMFQIRFNRPSVLGRFMADHAYTVYFNHALITVYFSYMIQSISLHPLLKFMLATIVVIVLCFLAAYVIRRVPLMRRIF